MLFGTTGFLFGTFGGLLFMYGWASWLVADIISYPGNILLKFGILAEVTFAPHIVVLSHRSSLNGLYFGE
jgi:hypothetical protein